MSTVFARDINFGPPGGFQGPGNNSLFNTSAPATSFENIITRIIAVMTIVAGIWFLFTLLSGAIGVISAGGDKAQVENSKKKVSNGLLGLVMVLIAVAAVAFVGEVLGVNFLSIGAFITSFY